MKKRVITHFQKNWKIWALLAAILALAAALRFVNVDWDESHHLHPDERFLSMITNDIKWPASVGNYFNTANSSLNPSNTGKRFFVYGTFPVFLTKITADTMGLKGYDNYTIVGRILSGIFDLLTILVIFLISKRIFNTTVAFLSAFLLSITVLHIQHSHFYVVDLFAAFFVVLAFYFLLLWYETEKIRYVLLIGAVWGLGIASKISALFFAIIIFLGCLLLLWKRVRTACELKTQDERVKAILSAALRIFGSGLLILLAAFIVFRIFQPYAFAGPHVWNIGLSESFKADMNELSRLHGSSSGFVPVLQWRGTSPFFQIASLTFFGIGLPLSILCWAGLLFGIIYSIKKKDPRFFLAIALAAFLLAFQALQFVKYSRYVLPAVPFLMLCAAFILWMIIQFALGANKQLRIALMALVAVLLVSCLFWPLAFTSMYLDRHPRVQASAWLIENLPPNSTISNEHWDDHIPFQLNGEPPLPPFKPETLTLFDFDNDAKVEKLSEQLSRIDYLFITSNRLYRIIPKLGDHNYTAHYYELLFDGKLGFELERTFTNYPSLLGIEFNDDNSEEAFTVYDHPKVFIFRKAKNLSKEELFTLIKGDLK